MTPVSPVCDAVQALFGPTPPAVAAGGALFEALFAELAQPAPAEPAVAAGSEDAHEAADPALLLASDDQADVEPQTWPLLSLPTVLPVLSTDRDEASTPDLMIKDAATCQKLPPAVPTGGTVQEPVSDSIARAHPASAEWTPPPQIDRSLTGGSSVQAAPDPTAPERAPVAEAPDRLPQAALTLPRSPAIAGPEAAQTQTEAPGLLTTSNASVATASNPIKTEGSEAPASPPTTSTPTPAAAASAPPSAQPFWASANEQPAAAGDPRASGDERGRAPARGSEPAPPATGADSPRRDSRIPPRAVPSGYGGPKPYGGPSASPLPKGAEPGGPAETPATHPTPEVAARTVQTRDQNAAPAAPSPAGDTAPLLMTLRAADTLAERAPADPVALSRQIFRQVTDAMTGAAGGPKEIVLTPIELGQLSIATRTVDKRPRLEIRVSRESTLALMQKNLDVLARELGAIGHGDMTVVLHGPSDQGVLNLPSFSASQGGRSGGQDREDRSARDDADTPEPDVPRLAGSPIPRTRPAGATQINIRM